MIQSSLEPNTATVQVRRDITAAATRASREQGSALDPEVSSGPQAEQAPAFEEVYREHRAMVCRTMRSLGIPGDLLEDACQEVFLVAFRRLPTFKHESRISTWLYAISRNIASNFRRAKLRRDVVFKDPGPLDEVELLPSPQGYAQDELLELADAAHLIELATSRMTGPKQQAFLLAEFCGLRAPEVSRATGDNAYSFYSRLVRARAEFDKKLHAAKLSYTRQGAPEPWRVWDQLGRRMELAEST